MKYVRQFCIILLLSFMGELLYELLPFPVPASVYGLVLMLAALVSGILKVDQVKETAGFLVEIMPVMFIPAGVGLMSSWGVLKPVLIPVAVITFLTTVIVMAVTGRVTQAIIRQEERRRVK
ncbi:MAG: CidA/LrgA family protein [Eubacteriales bacterium]|nr:CidA/LrgA family protein [Eubacteriales bacterium]